MPIAAITNARVRPSTSSGSTPPTASTPRPAQRAAKSAPVGSTARAEKAAKVAAPLVEPAATGAAGEVKKPRRSRVPKNLAAMYGESEAKRDVAPTAQTEKKRARRDAKTRALRKSLVQADASLLERLSAPAASALVVGEDEATAKRRSRVWQAACGKCGASATFRTPGALCPGCHAICLRDAAA